MCGVRIPREAVSPLQFDLDVIQSLKSPNISFIRSPIAYHENRGDAVDGEKRGDVLGRGVNQEYFFSRDHQLFVSQGRITPNHGGFIPPAGNKKQSSFAYVLVHLSE